MIPTIGRIIHYKRYEGQQPLPAIIIRVEGDTLHLDVFTREGIEFFTSDTMALSIQDAKAGEWFWPERIS